MTKEEIILANKEFLFPAVFHFYKEPLVIARAKDQYVWDADGNQYLDFLGGIVTVSVGHCNDQVNAKLHKQLDTLQHVSTLFANEPQAALAKKIASITPGGKLTRASSPTSGTEANEGDPDRARYPPAHGDRGPAPLVPRPFGDGDDFDRPGHVAPGTGAGRRDPRAQRVLLSLSLRAHLSELRRALRAGYGRVDPQHHRRTDRRLHRRADSGRRRIHPPRRNTSRSWKDRAQSRRPVHQR